jgi:cytochrome c biogenesis protein CcdA
MRQSKRMNTTESQQGQPSSHEYRMKVSKSGFYLLSAVLFIVASIPVATRGIASSTPMALARAVIGVLLLFSGGFMVATVVRSRLVLEKTQIRFRVVFREEVFPVSEIEGFRTITTGPPSHRVSRRVICVKGRREPIEIVPFSPDEFLQT